MPSDLADLVVAGRGGDRSAFDELVRATYADMYTLAYRLTGNEEDARDVVQDAFLRAYRGLRRFRGDARFSTWMYRITANCARSDGSACWCATMGAPAVPAKVANIASASTQAMAIPIAR